VSGRGAISNDRERIKELFSVAAKAWWDASDDPNIRLLTVTPDGPSTGTAAARLRV